jgi:hypothetical protein
LPAAQKRRKGDPVTVRGPWVAVSLDFLQSKACAELSPHAVKMLIDLISRLGRNAHGNGDVSATGDFLQARGWTSKATRQAALRELQDAELLTVTRQGGRRTCTLYALTLWPMDCDFSKLDTGPGAYTATDWQRVKVDGNQPPTPETPATWNTPRKNKTRTPATGANGPNMPPSRGHNVPPQPLIAPATGAVRGFRGISLPPPRGTFIETPSVQAASQPNP